MTNGIKDKGRSRADYGDCDYERTLSRKRFRIRSAGYLTPFTVKYMSGAMVVLESRESAREREREPAGARR